MNTYAQLEHALPPADVRQLMLDLAVVRAKQEHDLLKEELQDIYARVCTIRRDKDEKRLNIELRHLNDCVQQFMKEWSAHTQWEETELFPYATWYLGAEPDLFTLMEQEYEIAEEFLLAFLHALDRSVFPIQHEEAYRMASYLLQAYAVLRNRFVEEEEIMLALTDRSNKYDF